MLNALAGLAPAIEGTVIVAGRPMAADDSDGNTRWRRSAIGTVFQQGLLLPELDARDNVGLPLRLLGYSRARARARADDLLSKLGLTDLARRQPWQLSGGQRQRVAVARAIVHEPAVILADEPTGALDKGNSDLVIDLLQRVTSALGSTLIVVTHDEAIAARFAHRVRVHDGHTADTDA
jgi:putative ABC transport system ATP-binding protein